MRKPRSGADTVHAMQCNERHPPQDAAALVSTSASGAVGERGTVGAGAGVGAEAAAGAGTGAEARVAAGASDGRGTAQREQGGYGSIGAFLCSRFTWD